MYSGGFGSRGGDDVPNSLPPTCGRIWIAGSPRIAGEICVFLVFKGGLGIEVKR
jgi:hypothetical protein